MEEWIFTFGVGHEHRGHFIRIKGTYEEARAKMCEIFGMRWAFQYSAEEWNKWAKDPSRRWAMETEITLEEIGR